MKNIVLTRIDDRLLHGQVIVSWIPYLRATEVVIIDDEIAKDDFMSILTKEAAPENVKVHILTVQDAIDYLKGQDDGARVLILLKNIEYIKNLLDSNVLLNKVNVGNLSSGKERSKYYNTVYLSDHELMLLKEIAKKIEVEVQMLPKDKILTIE